MRDTVRRHETGAFLALTFGLAWGLALPPADLPPGTGLRRHLHNHLRPLDCGGGAVRRQCPVHARGARREAKERAMSGEKVLYSMLVLVQVSSGLGLTRASRVAVLQWLASQKRMRTPTSRYGTARANSSLTPASKPASPYTRIRFGRARSYPRPSVPANALPEEPGTHATVT